MFLYINFTKDRILLVQQIIISVANKAPVVAAPVVAAPVVAAPAPGPAQGKHKSKSAKKSKSNSSKSNSNSNRNNFHSFASILAGGSGASVEDVKGLLQQLT